MGEDKILEMAVLCIVKGREPDFEISFKKASGIIAASKGYVSHELRPNLSKSGQYLLLVWWEKLEDHTVGFRKSEAYQSWKEMLHPFYDPFPVVEHFGHSLIGPSGSH